MSNPLSVRRVIVQTIDKKGKPEGRPSYGVMAADSYGLVYNDSFKSLKELNQAIKEAGSILKVADDGGTVFPDADHEKIGTDNFYGKDWEKDTAEEADEDENEDE